MGKGGSVFDPFMSVSDMCPFIHSLGKVCGVARYHVRWLSLSGLEFNLNIGKSY